jgi:hypothetical protein
MPQPATFIATSGNMISRQLRMCDIKQDTGTLCLHSVGAGGDEDEEDTLDAFMRTNAPPPLRRQLTQEQEEERQ